MDKIKKLIVFYIIILGAATSMAQVDLLKSKSRPRIAEVLEYVDKLVPEPGIPAQGNRFAFSHFSSAIEDGAPQFISKLEKAYPGATFAFLGRDTQAISDVVDAFLQSTGQSNRVIQVGISKPALDGLGPKDIEKYLKYYGLDLDQIKDAKAFVFVDTVSSGEVIDGVRISGRQGRNLLQILYQAWINRGYDPKDLLEKVNMIALQVSTFKADDADNKKRYKDIAKLDEIMKANIAMLDASKSDTSKIGANMILPLVKDTKTLFNESGYDHFTGAWHEKFQAPIKSGGKLEPNPGEKTNEVYRKSILWLQHEIIDIVNTLEFREKVKSESEKLGVKFDGFKIDQTFVACKKTYK